MAALSDASAQSRPPRQGLSTFGGVFTPSILTILGIILFLRHGWVVGNAGLWRALGLIAIAHAVSLLTSISLAAIATNRRVRGGGDYFLISRSLGAEFGGALGLALFTAQSISVAFYCFGFGEVAASLVPDLVWATPRTMAICAALLLFVIALIGSDAATRFQYGIMAIMGAALISFFAGSLERADSALLAANLSAPAGSVPFWTLFAIFFPAVTGFTQGVSMSGDLADPRKSLPRGTFAAVALSLVVYTAAAVLFVAGAPLGVLAADYDAFRNFSLWPPLFDAGVVAATLSSALASFLGAPRILQAMARDEILPVLSPFGRGAGKADNPRRAVVLTAFVAGSVFLFGDLNGVARLISMFFLVSYGLLNFATYVEAHGASPQFRPRFRFFHARICLLGALACAGAMLAIDLVSGLAAIAIMVALHRYLLSRGIRTAWADSRPSYNFRRLKETIREIDRLELDEWSWHPNLLVFGENAERRDLLARFAAMFAGPSGFTTCVGIVEGEGEFQSVLKERAACEEELRAEIEAQGLDAFPLVVAAPDLRVAVSTLLQTWGIGPVRANTVMLDWREHLPEESATRDPIRYGRQLQSILRLGSHVLVLDVTGREYRTIANLEPEERRIDVWWWEDASCRLSLLLAYLLARSEEWEDCPIRVLVPCRSGEDRKLEAHLVGVLEQARIDASIEAVPDADDAKMLEKSADSSFVFFRVAVDGMQIASPFGGDLDELLSGLPTACIVAAASAVVLGDDPEPDERSEDAEEAPSDTPNELS